MHILSKKLFILLSLSLITLLAAFLYIFHITQPDAYANIWMLNVGQGESILLRDPLGTKILFDGGPDDTVLSELGRILPPWDHSLDLVIISHNHSDHLRGLIAVLQRYNVKTIWISGAIHNADDFQALQNEINQHHVPTRIKFFERNLCANVCPFIESIGQFNLQVYHPLLSAVGKNPRNPHDSTLVVKATYGQESILLTGDLNELHESEILTACQSPRCSLASNILQVPHHGSATGLLISFLKNIHPEIALIPVGIANKFGHPRPETISKLSQAHIPILRTDTQGRLHLRLSKITWWADTQH